MNKKAAFADVILGLKPKFIFYIAECYIASSATPANDLGIRFFHVIYKRYHTTSNDCKLICQRLIFCKKFSFLQYTIEVGAK